MGIIELIDDDEGRSTARRCGLYCFAMIRTARPTRMPRRGVAASAFDIRRLVERIDQFEPHEPRTHSPNGPVAKPAVLRTATGVPCVVVLMRENGPLSVQVLQGDVVVLSDRCDDPD